MGDFCTEEKHARAWRICYCYGFSGISTHWVGASDPNNTEREREARRNAHGLYPEVGDGAGDALPDTGVGVAAPPAGEPMMHGGVEGQLELQQRLACEQETVGQRLSKRRGQRVAA